MESLTATGLACSRCGRVIPTQAPKAAPLCLTCQLVTAPPPELPAAAMRVKRRAWPMLASAGALVAVLVVAFFVWRRHEAQKQLEDAYPVVPSPGDRVVLSKEAKAWAKGKKQLLATLATFDPWDVRVAANAAPCPVAQDVATQTEVDEANTDQSSVPGSFGDVIAGTRDPDSIVGLRLSANGELHEHAVAQVEQMLAGAARGRFRTPQGRAAVVSMIRRDALVVLDLDDDVAPEIERGGGKPQFIAGHRSGKAYAFDRETGQLRCAGAFDTSSSSKVSVLESVGIGLGNEYESLRRDFEAQTDRAVASALRVVAKPGDKAAAVGMAQYDVESPDVVAGIKQFTQACESGDPKACTALADSMEKGSIPYDAKQHVALLHKACDGGEMSGCALLARTLLLGRGVGYDVKQAIALYEKACNAKYWWACESLGRMYRHGTAVDIDRDRAIGYFKRGCDGGDGGSCVDLGALYYVGDGVTKDYAHAVPAFEQACKAADSDGCMNLATMYRDGTGVAQDLDRARSYALRACDLQDPGGCAYSDELSKLPQSPGNSQ